MACERQTFLSIIAAEERFARWNETKRPETSLSEDERGETSARRFLEGVYKETKRRGYLLLMSPRCNCTGQGKL